MTFSFRNFQSQIGLLYYSLEFSQPRFIFLDHPSDGGWVLRLASRLPLLHLVELNITTLILIYKINNESYLGFRPNTPECLSYLSCYRAPNMLQVAAGCMQDAAGCMQAAYSLHASLVGHLHYMNLCFGLTSLSRQVCLSRSRFIISCTSVLSSFPVLDMLAIFRRDAFLFTYNWWSGIHQLALFVYANK